MKESIHEDRRCWKSHYATIVAAQEDVEVYQHGDLDCLDCLRSMVAKHAALVDVFRSRLAAIGGAP